MAHNTRTESDATWTTGNYAVPATDWQDLDGKIFKALNGVDGGAWAPTSPIVIDGTSNLEVNAPCKVDYGGSLTTGAASRFVLTHFGINSVDWPAFKTGHALETRVLMQTFARRHARPQYTWQTSMQYPGSVQSMVVGKAGNPYITNLFVSDTSFYSYLRVHDYATLSQVVLNFRVGVSRSLAPRVMPQARIVRLTATGSQAGTMVALSSANVGADSNGYISVPRPTIPPKASAAQIAAAAAAWYNDGNPQTLVIPCDQNNGIDVSQYIYFIQVFEEAIGLYPAPSYDGVLNFEQKLDVGYATNPSDTKWPAGALGPNGPYTIDGGHSCVTGERVLIKDSATMWNGIWIVDATGGAPWTRAPDCQAPGDFTQNWWVNVIAAAGAVVNGGSQWECTGPSESQNKISLPTNDGPITPGATFARRVARGNVYHSAVMTFTGIQGMRWQ